MLRGREVKNPLLLFRNVVLLRTKQRLTNWSVISLISIIYKSVFKNKVEMRSIIDSEGLPVIIFLLIKIRGKTRVLSKMKLSDDNYKHKQILYEREIILLVTQSCKKNLIRMIGLQVPPDKNDRG